MRRLPAELRRALAREVKTAVADPLAGDIRAAWTGPYAPALSGATKTRVATDPQVIIGGSRRVVSGGASARDLVFGTEWGGGKRVKAIPGNARRRGHRRATTRQFAGAGQHAVYGTVARTMDRSLERFADAVDKIVGQVIGRG